jgi:hypothetical protein
MARLLHERIAAVIEGDGADQPAALQLVDEILRRRRRRRQRLVRDHVLAFRQRFGRDRVMEVVRRRDMHHMHVGIRNERLVSSVALARAQLLGLLSSRFFRASGHRDDVDIAETPHRIDVVRANEARADDPHAYSFHQISLISLIPL